MTSFWFGLILLWEDLLVFVEGLLSARGTPTISPWCVPTMQTVMEVQPIELSEEDLRNSIQVCVNTMLEGCIILDCLLSILALPAAKSQTQLRKYDIMNCDIYWILSSLARLWNVISPKKRDTVDDRLEQCVVILLETLIGLLGQVAKFRHEVFLASKTTALSSQVICTFISFGLSQSTIALEGSLCSALLELSRISAHSQYILAGFQENLLPVLREMKEDHCRWNASAVDLQVCSLWFANIG